MPLKVWLPQHAQSDLRHLDPMQPVKKRLCYEELVPRVGPFRFEPGLPLKKRVPDSLAAASVSADSPTLLLSTTPAACARPMPR